MFFEVNESSAYLFTSIDINNGIKVNLPAAKMPLMVWSLWWWWGRSKEGLRPLRPELEPSRLLLPPSSLRDPLSKRLMDETEGAEDLSHTPSCYLFWYVNYYTLCVILYFRFLNLKVFSLNWTTSYFFITQRRGSAITKIIGWYEKRCHST